jgi:hypothetical protein
MSGCLYAPSRSSRKRLGDEITSQDNEVRVQGIRHLHRGPDGHHREIRVEMKITELGYRKAIEFTRQTKQRNVDADEFWVIWLE